MGGVDLISNKFLTINSVKCGRFVIPFSQLNQRLCHFVRSIIIEKEDVEWGGFLGRTGSSTLVRLYGTNYVCITKHELKDGRALDEVRIASGFGGKLENITFDSAVFAEGDWSEEEEFCDILLLHAHKQSLNENPDYVHFIPVRAFNRKKIFASLIVACPFYENNFEVDFESGETKGFHQTTVVRDCVWDENYKSNAKYVESFYFSQKKEFPEDGMSGGAVFSIVEESDGLEVFLHGIIVRASSGKLKVVSVDFLLNLKEDVIHKQARREVR